MELLPASHHAAHHIGPTTPYHTSTGIYYFSTQK